MSEIFIFFICIVVIIIVPYVCSTIKSYLYHKQDIYVKTIEMLNKLPREYGEHYINYLNIYKEVGQYVIMYKPSGFVTRGDTLYEAVKKMYNKLTEFNII